MMLRRVFRLSTRGKATKVVSFPLADIGEGINEVEMLEWKVKVGDMVKEFQPLCDVRSDKATAEITSMHTGKVAHLHCHEGCWAKVGNALVDIEVACPVADEKDEEEVPQVLSKPQSTQISNAVDAKGSNERAFSSPRIRHAMRTYGFDEKEIHTRSNTSDVFTERDLKELIDKRSGDGNGRELVYDRARIVQRSNIRKQMARRMHSSLMVPSFSACEEVEMGPLIKYYQSLKEKTDYTSKACELHKSPTSASYNFSMLTLLIKIFSEAILQYPEINSQFVSDSKIRILESHNIGIAIDTDEGLVVPNIKQVEAKSIEEIYLDLHRLVILSKNNKLAVDDLARGSFTLSNIGSIGSIQSHPVVVPPESCIVSLGRVRALPRYRQNGMVYPASTMVISSSADHRVLDGAYLVRFLKRVRELIENPVCLNRFI
mmetsp:Transcript_6876/g.10412  ORF Transcript_6876/g.10412 Transcript_6876/m.10412 type:complete len:431 (-) Transcript_6876:35-1327(-)